MKLNKNIIFVFMIIFLLSLNFIVAKDINETDLNSETFESDDNLISIDNTNSQDNTNLNQNNIQSTNSTETISKENTDNAILNNDDGFNHVYVSPDGTGNGSDKNNPSSFNLPNTKSNTIIHMLDGDYLISSTVNLQNWAVSNVTIIADNPGQVTIYNPNSNNYNMFNNMKNVNNIKFENIKFLFNTTTTDTHSQSFFYTTQNNCINFSFENCSFISSSQNTKNLMHFGGTNNYNHNIIINNCYFSTCWIIRSTGTVLINNTKFQIHTPPTTKNFGPIDILKNNGGNCAKFTIANSNFSSSDDYSTLCTVVGTLNFENATFDHPYVFQIDNGKFPCNATFTYLNSEEIIVGTDSDFIINASLLDDHGNIIKLSEGIKVIILGQHYTFSYSNGIYQTKVTTSNETGENYIDTIKNSLLNSYLINCTEVNKPTIIVMHSHNVTVNTTDIIYGENATVNITVTTVESGKISYILENSKNEIIKTEFKEFSNNSTSIILDNLDADIYTVTISVLGTEKYGLTTVSKTFTVKKANPVTILVNNVTILDNVTINVTVPEGVTGTISVQIGEVYTGGYNNGVETLKTVDVNSGNVIITYDPLVAKDTYALGWSFTSNNPNYNSVSNNNWNSAEGKANLIKFKVVKLDSNLTIKTVDVDWGNNVTVNISTDSRFSGNITVKLNTTEKVVKITDGSGSVSFDNLKAGNYSITAKLNATDLFAESEKEFNVTVNRINSNLTVSDIEFDWNTSSSTDITYTGATGANASIDETPVNIEDNKIILPDGLKAGTYTLIVSTVPDENHTSVSRSVKVTVKRVNSTLTLGNDIVFDYKSSNSTTATFTGATNITAVVVNQNANISIKDNTITVSNLNAGEYNLTVSTVADENHTSVNKTVKVTVNKINANIVLNNITLDYGSSNSTVYSGEGIKDITATINGKPVSVNSTHITVSDLNAGNYTLNITVNPDDNHNSITTSVNVTVNKIKVHIDIRNAIISFNYGGTGLCDILTDGANNLTVSVVDHPEAVITVNGSIYSISNLTPGNYTLKVVATPDANHISNEAECNITVEKVSVDESKSVNIDVPANSQSPTFSIDLGSDATGNFTVSVDGKVVETKELVNGKASITVANLASGNHKIGISYTGDANYAPINKETTVTIPSKQTTPSPAKVTKKSTKIAAKNKAFKAKTKVKKYTITLKSGKTLLKKVKVTLKVGKKTYTAKTNNKGKATFKIKKLTKKGKYTAVIKFKGNSNYKASSKKVKITVKK